MELERPDFDVGIIGGGPGGAAAAGYLAKAGLSCVLYERELFPRPHVGESLVPASTRVFRDLDFLGTMDEAGFVIKYGAAWTTADDVDAYGRYSLDFEGVGPDCQVDIRFDERPQAGVNRNYTWHVDRGKFDLLLLQHAQKLGATVCEGVSVQGVDFDDGPLPRIHARIGRKLFDTTVRVVIDASGRKTLLGNQKKLKVKDPVFDQFALHTWFDGFDRGSHDKSDYIFIHFLPITNTWTWQIPITETVTSFGVVTQKAQFAKSRTEREKFFWDCIATHPAVDEKLRKATRTRPFTEEGDYSYAMKEICGDRFLLVGDAGRFVDPIFSTGVSIALNSARLATADILKAAETGDFGRHAFANFEKKVRNGTRHWYEFITLYYRLNVLFTYFIKNPKYRLDVLQLLQGDVYDDEELPVLHKMRSIVSDVEKNESHVWHKLLGNLAAPALKGAL